MESTKQWVIIKVSTIRDLIFSYLDPETVFQRLQWGGVFGGWNLGDRHIHRRAKVSQSVGLLRCKVLVSIQC